jgi:GTP-binding protein
MYNYLKHYNIPLCIICTKVDKVSRNSHEKQINLISKTLGTEKKDLILFSSVTKMGRQEVYDKLVETLEIK